MPIEIEGAAPGLPPRRWARVIAIEARTPRVRRLRLAGEDLEGFRIDAPGSHIKLVLPAPGEDRPALPLRYEERRAVFADGVTPPVLRTYTPLHFDEERLELEIDLLIHGEGAASAWVEHARPGDEIIVAGPRGGWTVPTDGDWYVVVADDTAVPAAEQVLAALPPQVPATALLEVATREEERALPGAERATTRWLARNRSMPGEALESALAHVDLAQGTGYAWVACEAGSMRRMRRALLDRGLPAERMVTRGYWKLGAPDHPDGDYGQDVE